MTAQRTETDTLGSIAVAADRYWGAQTERALAHFPAGRPRFVWGRPVIGALGLVKRCAARANRELGVLSADVALLIEQAATEVEAGALDAHFPLAVFQTGSGTQTNMNANEVIANRAIELAGGRLGSKVPVHPNDHVNRGQSSNDVFPTVMHVAIAGELRRHLYPAIDGLRDVLRAKAAAHADVVKIGRTHLQDATPLTLGQEVGGWEAQLAEALAAVRRAEEGLHGVAIGATAVGTGLGTHPDFGARCAALLAEATGMPFARAANPFAAIAAHDAVVAVSGALRTLAGALMKIANDVRWLASGPRAGLGEIRIPANEPGSSIMPGKVNPTQCEALTMVSVRVFGNDATVAFAGSQGNFELNVYKPVMLDAVLESIDLLAEATAAFGVHCVAGLEPDLARIHQHLEHSLMLVTALVPAIGYDRAAAIATKAYADGITLRAAAMELGAVTEDEFDRLVDPRKMIRA